ncbi:unnamed protein product [Brachionus calyciflorus]|uniref:MANSC domain-containing protein n=1 Tax=Brachionus calyciflorus TaxID=104777 RepID=A0A814PZY5_9BILA|nr:unnamed protein product [Brachionus calyciflorus]
MRKILLFIFISLIPLIRTKEICDPLRTENDFPQGSLSRNTKILTGMLDFKPVANATSLRECILSCCQDKKCNFAFLKDSTNCFLITCSDTEENSCQIGQNLKKLPTDPVDYLVLIKPIQKSNIESLIRKEKEDLNAFFASQSFENQCSPNENTCEENEKCLFNKLNNVYECVCPREFGFYKIDGVCREYLPDTNGCELYIDKCPKDEECLAKNEVSKHGTCQCKINYRRNLDTFICEPVDNRQTKSPKNNRKRPIVTQEMITSDPDDTFWKNLLAQLGIMENKNKQKYESTTQQMTTTTTKITDPPKIFTSNLQANAGFDLNVYYPSRMCTLNGSLTSFLQEKIITRWEWIKDSSSPAFGVSFLKLTLCIYNLQKETFQKISILLKHYDFF